MSEGYRYIVDEAVLTALLVLEDDEIARLIAVFESLAANPTAPADAYYHRRSGWVDYFKKCGSFAITYRRDDQEHCIYVVKVDPVRR